MHLSPLDQKFYWAVQLVKWYKPVLQLYIDHCRQVRWSHISGSRLSVPPRSFSSQLGSGAGYNCCIQNFNVHLVTTLLFFLVLLALIQELFPWAVVLACIFWFENLALMFVPRPFAQVIHFTRKLPTCYFAGSTAQWRSWPQTPITTYLYIHKVRLLVDFSGVARSKCTSIYLCDNPS